jgi:hypothetical protein
MEIDIAPIGLSPVFGDDPAKLRHCNLSFADTQEMNAADSVSMLRTALLFSTLIRREPIACKTVHFIDENHENGAEGAARLRVLGFPSPRSRWASKGSIPGDRPSPGRR